MSKIEKIKNHLKEHKREYLIGGGCLVFGAIGGGCSVFGAIGVRCYWWGRVFSNM